jgi:hypothetical protein
MTRGSRRSSTALCIAGLSLAALALSPSSAGALVGTAVSCDSYTLETPFLRWNDPFSYQLAPDGTFERRARGWTLTGGARVGRGNETFYVHRSGESRSMYLPTDSSATSPAMCVGLEYPTLRTFALNRRHSGSSRLKVEVLFDDPVNLDPTGLNCLTSIVIPGQPGILGSDGVCALLIGTLSASRAWDATIPMPVVANLLALLPDNRTAVAFRFSPQDAAGDWRIDDVYVDPYRTR